jgi:hypothetical protein
MLCSVLRWPCCTCGSLLVAHVSTRNAVLWAGLVHALMNPGACCCPCKGPKHVHLVAVAVAGVPLAVVFSFGWQV